MTRLSNGFSAKAKLSRFIQSETLSMLFKTYAKNGHWRIDDDSTPQIGY
jgi:hypothetical protein